MSTPTLFCVFEHALTLINQAVIAPRALRTPRPATVAASPATSPATARAAAAPSLASLALSATRWVPSIRCRVPLLTHWTQCGEIGHIARNCSKGGAPYGGGYGGGGYGGGGFGGKTCYSCGGIGHVSRKS